MKVTYTLSKRVASDGTAEVLVRFYSGNVCDQKAHSGIRVPAQSWDAKNGCTTRPRYVTPDTAALADTQRTLDDLTAYLYAAFSRSYGRVTSDWLHNTIAAFHGVRYEKRRTLADVAEEYTRTHNLAPGTRRRYAVIVRWLQAYRTLYLDTLSTSDIEAIERTLSKKAGCNTLASKMKALRAFVRWAHLQGWVKSNPFDRYTAPSEVYGSVSYLTAEERDAIATADLPKPLAIQRDIFVFQCWVGCRVSDLYALQRENITRDGFLEYIPGKTSRSHPVVVRVPLSETALAIVNKYKHHACGGIFPFACMPKYNEAIKDVLRLCGITRSVIIQDPHTLRPKSVPLWTIASSHLARRTFAANAFAATGSERIVSSMTGHAARSASFVRYTDVTDQMKKDALKKAEKKPT